MALVNTHKYDDIINLPHPVFPDLPSVTEEMRAGQFAPFAALTGFDDEITDAGNSFIFEDLQYSEESPSI